MKWTRIEHGGSTDIKAYKIKKISEQKEQKELSNPDKMKISSVLASFTVAVSAFVPMNVINNNEKCGLGLQQTRKICSACSVIGQLSIANQNRQMRLKLACLSLISNQCCSETTNRFLHWIVIENANHMEINLNITNIFYWPVIIYRPWTRVLNLGTYWFFVTAYFY